MIMGMTIEPMIIWLIIFVLLVVIEIATMGLTTIWFAGGTLAAIVADLLGAPILVQLILFVVVSLVLLFFTRPIAVKYFNKDRTKTNIDAYVGKQAIVVSEINNLQGIGRVNVGGIEWAARSTSEDVSFNVGAVVVVEAIEGVKLIVSGKVEEK